MLSMLEWEKGKNSIVLAQTLTCSMIKLLL